MQQIKIAVIGLGAAGLVALKNLKEEGFNVTGFERNSYIGGLWKYSENDQTSVLNTTVVNISKERGCFSDFPYPESVPSYPTGVQVHQYLTSYAEHFDLGRHVELNCLIQQIVFNDEQQRWIIKVQDQTDKCFDKVVIAIGGMVGLITDQASRGYNYSPGNVDAGKWTKTMDDLGGTGVNQYLGYGWKGWWFWLRNMRFCRLLMDGVWTPHIYRVFDGKRKRWEGAREAIELVNASVAENKKSKTC